MQSREVASLEVIDIISSDSQTPTSSRFVAISGDRSSEEIKRG